MGRREFLRRGVTAVTFGIAGCNTLVGSEDVDNEYTPSTEDRIALAVGQLNRAALAVNEYRRQADENPEEVTFDEDQPRERIASARNALDVATESASGDENADIVAVRSYADAVAGTVDAVVGLVDASERLERARETLGNDEVDTNKASSTLEHARTESSTALSAYDDAIAALDDADAGRLRAVGAEYDAMRSGLDTLGGYVVGVDGLTAGYERQVAGIESLQRAREGIDSKSYDVARDAFEAAVKAFTEAANAFAEVVSEAAEQLVSDLENGQKRARSLERLTAGYVALLDSREHVRSAQSGIENDAFNEARTALEEANETTETASDRFEEGATVLDGEFVAEFETARDRATAIGALVDGYLSLLDARDHISDAETAIGADEYDSARTALEEANADSVAADESFAAGQDVEANLVPGELETGRERASALKALSSGYVTLLDARDELAAGESAFLDGRYDDAIQSFSAATETSRAAESTFEEGAATDDSGPFAEEFERAERRAGALASLSEGYATMVAARREAADGREHLDERDFDTAKSQFEAADDSLAEAETTFEAGQSATEGEFEAEFDRALCQVGHLRTAVGHFVAASEAGSDRNLSEFRTQRDAGETALNRVDDC